MAVDITIGTQKFRNVSSYSVTEDSSPINPADASGGFGQINFTTTEEPLDRLLHGKLLDLEDGIKGTTRGSVTGISSNDGSVSITADSRLGLLMTTRQVAPFVGTLGDAFRYYLDLAGITAGIVVDASLESLPVVFSGWYGNLWEFLNKQLCPAFEIELSLVSDNIVLRPVRTNIAYIDRDSSRSWSVQNQELAQSVEVYWYDSEYVVNGLTYPKGGWNSDVQIYQVDAGETIDIEIPVDVSITSLDQPDVIDYVARDYVGPASVYSVIGNDGLPITAAQWTAQGGKLEVSIGEDTKTILVKLTGSSETQYSPYRVAASAGDGSYYSTLRLVGDGVQFTKNLITIPTGIDPERTATEVGTTIDNLCITSLSQAYDAGRKGAKAYGTAGHTINVSSSGINRAGTSGNVRYPTFDEFAVMYTGTTFDAWAVIWAGQTFNDFQTAMYDLVRNDFDNQAFGNVAGARVPTDYSWFRIRTATTSESQVSYTAESDTLFSDLEVVWAAQDFDAWTANWTGKTFDEYEVIPLWI